MIDCRNYIVFNAKIGNYELPLNTVNENGETVLIERGVQYDMFKCGEKYIKTTTFQNNSWIKYIVYYEDGCIEEWYEKDGGENG